MIFIILPSYNEEKNLVKIFKKIQVLHKNFKSSVVLVDDGSSDLTYKLVKRNYGFKIYYLKHKINKGLSCALETGFKKVAKIGNNKDVIITLDSDNTHPINLIPKMIKKIKMNNDIVIASRFQKNSRVKGVSFLRQLMSLGAKFIFQKFFPFKNLNDYTCNFRAYKFELIKKLLKNKNFFKNEDFNIAAKIILYLTNGYKNINLIELPFKLSYNYKIGQSKMKLVRNILLTLRLVFFKKFY